jgi:hypothetical protein
MEVIWKVKKNCAPFKQEAICKNEHKFDIVLESYVPRGDLWWQPRDKRTKDTSDNVHNQKINSTLKRHLWLKLNIMRKKLEVEWNIKENWIGKINSTYLLQNGGYIVHALLAKRVFVKVAQIWQKSKSIIVPNETRTMLFWTHNHFN